MSLLSLVQEACGRIGILKPAVILSNTDPQIIQLLSLANKEGQLLAKRAAWTALQLEGTFITVATEIQGTMTTIAPNYRYVLNDTIWNRTQRRPVFGPKSPAQWQQQKASAISGPFNCYRIVGTVLKFNPVPAAGESCFFEYISRNWVSDIALTTTRAAWSADTDFALLDEELMVDGLVWRWKQTKGLSYSEDFADYEREVTDALARDGTKPVLNLDNYRDDLQPGIMVPLGNW